jgi:hypothetical protein
MLGKLKRTLRERCPECGNLLQLRENQKKEIRRGITIFLSKEYIACSYKNCSYTRDVEQKRERRQEEIFE